MKNQYLLLQQLCQFEKVISPTSPLQKNALDVEKFPKNRNKGIGRSPTSPLQENALDVGKFSKNPNKEILLDVQTRGTPEGVIYV